MLLEKIMINIDFDKKIENLKDEEMFGIYEEKGKIKINYPLFAQTFLESFNIVKEAKQGEEKFDYYIYGKNHWILLDSDLLKGLVRKLLNSLNFFEIGAILEKNLVNEILNLSKRIEEVEIMYHKMNFVDCVYSFKDRKFEPLDLENYFTRTKEYGKNEMQMSTPIFDKFMMDIMCSDADAVNFLLQLMGNCISGIQKLEKFIVFIGAGSNGKSTLLKLLSNIVGDNYVETRDINKLDDKFALQGLEKKKLLISSESSNKREISNDNLKRLTTPKEKVYIDVKNEKPITAELSLNLIFACNQPIEFGKMDINDKSIARRIIVVPFNRVFDEMEKDRDLDEKLEAEIPGITLKLIKAYEELVKGNYILPESELIEEATEDYIAKHIHKKSPSIKIKNFIDMYLEKDEDCIMSIRYMYEKYQEKFNDITVKEQTFAKEVRLAMPESDKRDPSKKGKVVLDKEGENSSKFFIGYKLKENRMRKSLSLSSKENLEDVI